MYLAEVTGEVGHAQYLSNKLAVLGITPQLAPDLSPPPSDPAIPHFVRPDVLLPVSSGLSPNNDAWHAMCISHGHGTGQEIQQCPQW